MTRYLIKRFVGIPLMLIGISFVSFFIVHAAPGDPTTIATDLNPKVGAIAKERLRKYYGLDRPLYVQYGMWLGKMVRLDFGTSFGDHRKVIDKIRESLPITVLINVLSLVVIFFLSMIVGVYSALTNGTRREKLLTVLVFSMLSMPIFWLAILMQIAIGIRLDIVPISGLTSLSHDTFSLFGKFRDIASHLVVPVFVETVGGIAGLSRYFKSSMLGVLKEEYITALYARGIPRRRVIFAHALRNALLPAITILGLSIPGLIGGSIIVEQIFGIPGMGQLFWQSVMARDYPTIMGILVITALLTLVGNIVADVSYGLADPRISRRGMRT